jgi:two-component system sensor histidine kinase BarA
MQKISLKAWVTLLSIVPTILLSSAILSYFSYQRYVEIDQLLIERSQAIIEPLAIAISPLVLDEKINAVQQLINFTHRSQSEIMRNITVFDNKNKTIVRSNHLISSQQMQLNNNINIPTTTEYEESNDLIIFQTPIFYQHNDYGLGANKNIEEKEVIGYLAALVDRNQVNHDKQQQLIMVIVIIFLASIITIAFVIRLLNKVTSPITLMLRSVERIREGKLESRINGALIGELNLLKNGINAMAQSLCDNHEEMQANIDQATIDLRESLEQFEIHNIEMDDEKRKAQEANKVKSQFLANMSHELLTPLNAVIGFTRQVLKTPLSNTQRDYLQTIEGSSANLLAIINDILDFSTLDAGKMVIEKTPFSVRETLEKTMSLLAPSAHKKNVELSLKVAQQIPHSLIGDPHRIKQILINLASNAIKFTDRGSVNIDIESFSENENEITEDSFATFKVSVNDTGIGMSVEQQEKIFKAFAQVDNSVTRLYGGTGLGLVISQRLVTEMNGDIGFISDAKHGSTFWFTFRCEVNPISDQSKLVLSALQNKHILYFEQHTHSRIATSEMLESWKMQVCAVKSLEQISNALLQDIKFDYALIGHDIKPAALNELKQLIISLKNHIPSIHLAINSNSPNLQQALISVGVRSCLSKPLTMQKLSQALAPQSINAHLYLQEAKESKAAIKVLAVDDNDANLKLIRTLLREQVTEVITATNGKEALQLCENEKFSLIFMDVQMPIMDGISASTHIKAQTINTKTPIIAVTAHVLSTEKDKLLQQGFDSYLAKPIDESMLRHSIYEYCTPELTESSNTNTNIINQLTNSHQEKPLTTEPETIEIELCDDQNADIIDWTLAMQRAGNKTVLAKDMLQGLVSSLPETKRMVSEALASQDLEQLKTLVHKLNGACCYSGVPNLGKLTHHIETQLKKGAGVDDLEPEFFEFFEHIDSVIDYAPSVLTKLTSSTVS